MPNAVKSTFLEKKQNQQNSMRPELMNAARSMQKNTAGELPDHMTSQLITKETQTYSNLVFIYCY